MLELKELISYFYAPTYAGKNITRISKELDVDIKELEEKLKELELKGIIFKARSGDYFLCSRYDLLKGKIIKIISNGAIATYVDKHNEEHRVRINEYDMKDAFCYDEVLLSLIDEDNASIYKVIKRNEVEIVGYYHKGKRNYVVPDDSNLPFHIYVENEFSNKAVEGHKVLAKITSFGKEIKGEVIKILGHANDPKVELLSLVYEFNAPYEFSDEALLEAKKVAKDITKEDLINREDYRDHLVCTIDGKDAKDLDDAIEVSKLDNGNYLLGVHIADVSNYVKVGGALDKDAFNRGTSIYMVNTVVPMLPHILSNGICSLNPNEDRLAMSCIMEINNKGKVVNYKITPSIIQSKYRLNYDDVNAFYKGEFKYDDKLAQMLNLARELSDILHEMKVSRGALEIESNEPVFELDKNDKVVDIKLRSTDIGERVIEDFMVMANETTARHVANLRLPYIYRVHDKPKLERIKTLQMQLKPFGMALILSNKGVSPFDLQNLLERSKNKRYSAIISNLVLRSFAKAIYDSVNIGHFGLGSECYCHFTSPIRRYPDLQVHRLLKMYCGKNRDFDRGNLLTDMTYIASHCSTTERRAVDIERAADDLKKVEYIEQHYDEVFNGVISGVIQSGFFVELDNTVEGLVRFETLNDYFVFDPDTLTAVGEGSRKRFAFGDRVKVRLKSTNKKTRQIEFYLVK